ncbi:MAG: 16S rRNA (adenine(1518)-N(6)/adenine(1519)-N(6))-dimethyltransferase RsmA [Planctomycetes bacterium]|nr:16S rRNA (adenine(1518)-N(6)/adenine(1519)-N(6))-dimethyltransferase RsmA [Planctomycetota bacterium]
MGSYRKLRARLDRAGIRPSTRRGQNFLLDANQLRFIAETACLDHRDVILEVGPGSGFLTRRLALSGGLVLAVELDHGLLPLAEEETAGLPNVFYLRADILAGKNHINPAVTERLEELLALKAKALAAENGDGPYLKCVSNLPYSAGTPFVMNTLSSPLPWTSGVYLLQQEVAERMIAPPGGKNYGALSISVALAATASIERTVPPRSFWPRPNVESAVILVRYRPEAERTALPWTAIRAVCTAVFGSRRKILKNALKGLFPDGDAAATLARLEIDPEIRGECLTPMEFLRIATSLPGREGPRPRTIL